MAGAKSDDAAAFFFGFCPGSRRNRRTLFGRTRLFQKNFLADKERLIHPGRFVRFSGDNGASAAVARGSLP